MAGRDYEDVKNPKARALLREIHARRREAFEMLAGRTPAKSYSIPDEPKLQDPKAERLFRESVARRQEALYWLSKS